MKSNNNSKSFTIVAHWYNKKGMKDYQIRSYNGELELWVNMACGWMKSLNYCPLDIKEGDIWEKACINSGL